MTSVALTICYMNHPNLPLVSIVMATFNRAAQVEDTVINIFEQDYKAIELIIINDGSVDDTKQVLENISQNYPITIIHNAENLGLQRSLNLGIKMASGKYIARIDDHDRWIMKNKISKQVQLLESDSKIGLVGTGYQNGKNFFVNPPTDDEIRRQILMRSPFCHVSILMSKQILDSIGGYDETLSYSEDWDLWLRIGKISKMANFSDIMVATKEEDLSLSDTYFLRQLPINRKIVSKYYRDYPLRLRARFYHQFLKMFFAIFKVNGVMHRLMKGQFRKSFNLSK